MKQEQNIPEQQGGGQTDTRACTQFSHEEAAVRFFKIVCERLKQVNQWAEISGTDATRFVLTDSTGAQVFRGAEEGDCFRIDIPGPGNTAGDGFDWVCVEEMSRDPVPGADVFFIRVRPCIPPGGETRYAAHFFKDKATSTFMIRRTGNMVCAEVHGRNEKPNTDTELLTDKVRNAVIGTASLLGFSLPQWKMLVTGLVSKDQ